MSSSIAVIGGRESVLCYMSVGFTVYEETDPAAASRLLRRLANEETAVVFIIEDLAVKMEEEIARYRSRPTPAVIVIPGASGSTGYGMAAVKRAVERAVGADISLG